jgi:hypothetical protein
MATETGGELFVVQPSELPSLTPFTAPHVLSDFRPLLVANGVLSGATRSFAVAVDTTIYRVGFSVTADTALSVVVKRPDGTIVSAGASGVTIETFSTGKLVTVEAPPVGSWTVEVTGTGEYSVAAKGNSPIFVEKFSFVDYNDVKHPGFLDVEGQPVAGQPGSALGIVGGTPTAVTFDAVSLEGDPLGTLPMSEGHPDADTGEYTGTFTPPSVPFRVIVRGVEAGVPFQRIVPTVFRPQPVRVFSNDVPEFLTLGIPATATFWVSNTGPAATFDIAAHDEHGFVTSVSPPTLSLPQNGVGAVQVSLLAPAANPVTGSPSASLQLTVSATVQGQPSLTNSASVDIEVKSAPPAATDAVYYLHRESSTVTWGASNLSTSSPEAPTLIRTSGNVKGHSAGTGGLGWWDTSDGVPGFEGVIPTGSVVTVKLWMRKTTSWGTVFPKATILLTDSTGPTLVGPWSALCDAVGTVPLDTTLRAYTFSCQTTQPIDMFAADRLQVSPGYSMTVGPGNHNMEIQMHLEGTTDSAFTIPNPR